VQGKISALTRENASACGKAAGSFCSQKITGEAKISPTLRLFVFIYSLRHLLRRGFIPAVSIYPHFFRDNLPLANLRRGNYRHSFLVIKNWLNIFIFLFDTQACVFCK
jgi:hypothetical protein